MKPTALLAGIMVICFATASLAGDDSAPIKARGNRVILKSSTKPITLIVGDQPLDNPHTFVCESVRGCVVVMSASVQYVDSSLIFGDTICSFVDGVPGIPGCYGISQQEGTVTRTQLKVSQGTHVVQTKSHSLNASGAIAAWEVDYSIYERNPPPN